MIVIPENVIYNELENLIKKVWDDHLEKVVLGTVSNGTVGTSGFTLAVSQQGSLGVPEVTDITTVADVGGSLGGMYFTLNTPSSNWFFWFQTGNNVAPILANLIPVQVNIAIDDDADTVAEKLAAVINMYPIWFTAEVTDNEITVTNVETDARRRSLLYAMFGSNQLDRLNYYDQMVSMIEDRYNTKKRKFGIFIGWNPSRTTTPCVSIMLPNEEHSPKRVSNTTGVQKTNYNQELSDQKTASYQTTYDLLISSDNENEVVLLYVFLKSLILIGGMQFDRHGLQNMSISGRDITMDFDLMPRPMYHRTVGLSFFYDNRLPSLEAFTNATSVVVQGGLVVNVNPVTNYVTILNGAGTILRIVQMGGIADLGFILFTDSDGQQYDIPVGVNVTATYAPPVYEARSDSDWPVIYQGSAPVGTLETTPIWIVVRFTYTDPDSEPLREEAEGAWTDRENLDYN